MRKINLAALVILIFGAFIMINCNPKPSVTGFIRHDIDTVPPNNPWIKIAADLDKDANPDIIVGGQKGPLIWYKSPNWTKHPIVDGGYNTVDGEAADIDKDGDLDIIVGGLMWYENPNDLKDNPDQAWKMHRIAEHRTHDIEISDMNKDGLPDVITRDQSAFSNPSGNTIHIWYQTKDTTWIEDIINCPHGEGIKTSDMDNDGDDDIVTGGIWYENLGGAVKAAWKNHVYCEWHPDASVEVADINNDGRKDIFLTPAELAKHVYKISWFEAPLVSTGKWAEHVVADSVECVIHSLRTGDFNNDGMADFVFAEMHQGRDPDEVVVALNKEKGKSWDRQVVFDKGSHSIAVLDYDNDGDLDFFGANWSGNYQPLQLWENILIVPSKK